MTDRSAQDTWTATLGQLEMELPRTTFDTWLRETEGLAFEGMDLLVQVPSVFTIAWLEQRMYQTILRALRQSSGELLDVRFQVSGRSWWGDNVQIPIGQWATPAGAAPVAERRCCGRPPRTPMTSGVNFDRKYSFNSFVVGNSNRMAFSAAQAVADAPGQAYNPLFLYSGVGLGKTHLLHAIGQQASRSGKSVLYVSSEQFTNDFISAIRNRTTEEFRQRYRSVQVLLIDDVQFMSGKEQTQEGFFPHLQRPAHRRLPDRPHLRPAAQGPCPAGGPPALPV